MAFLAFCKEPLVSCCHPFLHATGRPSARGYPHHAEARLAQCYAMVSPLRTAQAQPGLSAHDMAPLLAGCGSADTSLDCLLARHSGCRSTTRAARLSVDPCLYAARVIASATASGRLRGLGTSPGRLGMTGACTSSPGLCLALSAWRALGPVTASGVSPSASPADASASLLLTVVPAPPDGGAGELAEGTGSRGMALGRAVMGASLPARHPVSVMAMSKTLQAMHKAFGAREKAHSTAHRQRTWCALNKCCLNTRCVHCRWHMCGIM